MPSNLGDARQWLHPKRRAASCLQVLLLVLLGYVALLGVPISAIVLVATVAWALLLGSSELTLVLAAKLALVSFLPVYFIVRRLWIRLDTPAGYLLSRDVHPALFAELDALQKGLAATAVHQVILTSSFNAGIVHTPRGGILGWHRNTLLIGLPLLMALGPQHARAVLAHELGHLRAHRGAFGGWAHRLRAVWRSRLASFRAGPSFGARVLSGFVGRYLGYFDACCRTLVRDDEFDADASAVAMTSAATVAGALLSSEILAEVLEEDYWAPVFRHADNSPEPIPDPYRGLARFVSTLDGSRAEFLARAERALAQPSAAPDTHPSLSERIAMMGAPRVVPSVAKTSAAHIWLGDDYPAVIADFECAWVEQWTPAWRFRHTCAQTGRERIAALKARPEHSLGVNERWELAALAEELEPVLPSSVAASAGSFSSISATAWREIASSRAP